MRRNIIRLSGLWRKIDTNNGNNQSLSNYQVLIMLTTPPPPPRSLPYRREVRGDNPGSDGNSDWRDDYRILDDKFH